jgi:thiol-disulfide isomerase/thioredoxin
MKVNRIHSLLVVLVLSIGSTFSQGIAFQEMTFEEAKVKAKEEGKAIFVDAYAIWCGPCKWMSANIFPIEKIGLIYNEKFIPLKIDMEKGEGLEIAKMYSVNAYPTLLFLNPEGKVLMRVVGASQDVSDYLEFARVATDPEKNMLFLSEHLKEGLSDKEFMKNYLKTYSMADQLQSSVVDNYFLQYDFKDWLTSPNWKMINEYVTDIESMVFMKLIDQQEEVLKVKGDSASDYFSNQIFSNLYLRRYRARSEEDVASFKEAKSRWLKAWPDQTVAFKLDLLEAERSKNDEEWISTALKGAEQFVWDDANYLNNIAWTLYEKTEEVADLKQALRIAQRAVELNPASHIIDTQAHLQLSLGDEKGAVETENEAVRIAKENGEDSSSYEAFIAEIKSAKK